MSHAYLVTPRRLPVGRRKGGLSEVHPVDLAAAGMRASIDASGVDPGAVDDVVFGCVGQIGPQTGNIARLAWLTAGLPETCRGSPSIGNAARPSRRSTSPHRPSCPVPPTWSWRRSRVDDAGADHEPGDARRNTAWPAPFAAPVG